MVPRSLRGTWGTRDGGAAEKRVGALVAGKQETGREPLLEGRSPVRIPGSLGEAMNCGARGKSLSPRNFEWVHRERASSPAFGRSIRNLDIRTRWASTELLVVVKEFTLNRCPFQSAGQMMTPDRESCRGARSRQRSLNKIQGAWFHGDCMGLLGFAGGIGIHREAARDGVQCFNFAIHARWKKSVQALPLEGDHGGCLSRPQIEPLLRTEGPE